MFCYPLWCLCGPSFDFLHHNFIISIVTIFKLDKAGVIPIQWYFLIEPVGQARSCGRLFCHHQDFGTDPLPGTIFTTLTKVSDHPVTKLCGTRSYHYCRTFSPLVEGYNVNILALAAIYEASRQACEKRRWLSISIDHQISNESFVRLASHHRQ